MLEITDPVLKLSMLGYLVRCIDAGEFGALIDAGFTADQLEALRRRPMVELSHMIDLDLPVRLAIDPDEVQRVGEHYDQSVRELQLIDYFLSHGTHPDLAATLFRRAGIDMRGRAQIVLGSTPKLCTRGRVDESVRESIRSSWQRIVMRDIPTVERLHALHQEFQTLSIDRMCAELEALFGTYHARPRSGTPTVSG